MEKQRSPKLRLHDRRICNTRPLATSKPFEDESSDLEIAGQAANGDGRGLERWIEISVFSLPDEPLSF